MKRCPQCNRVETDEALKFCRVDGATLVSESGSLGSETGTAQLGTSPDEVHTSILPHKTDAGIGRATGPTTSLPGPQSTAVTEQLSIKQRPKVLIAVAAILLVCAIAAGYFIARPYLAANNTSAIESIAVLPFVNASGDKETEFLSDGISETLINHFTRIPTLRVTARSTAFRYKGKDIEPQKIGSELGVGSVLTGKLLQRGDALTIQVDLIKTADGVQIWGERYEGKSADIVNIQQRIASDVSAQLRLKLTGAQQQQIAKTYTQDPEAYQHYLRGRYYWNRRTAVNLKKALEEFTIATGRDPNYALAFVGLADCYMVLNEYAGVPSIETLPKAKSYAERALSLDSQLAEARTTLAAIEDYSWRFADSERQFKLAIEINPNYPTTYHWYSILLRNTGRFDDAAAMIKRAQELDPVSSVIAVNVARTHQLQHNDEAAIQVSLKLIEADPGFPAAHEYLALSYLRLRRNAEAVASAQKAVELSNRSAISLGDLGYIYASIGKKEEARALLKELELKHAQKEANGVYIAVVYVGLGEKDKAFEWLEKDFQARNGQLVTIRWQLQFDALRSEPRFQDLLKRMGVPE